MERKSHRHSHQDDCRCYTLAHIISCDTRIIYLVNTRNKRINVVDNHATPPDIKAVQHELSRSNRKQHTSQIQFNAIGRSLFQPVLPRFFSFKLALASYSAWNPKRNRAHHKHIHIQGHGERDHNQHAIPDHSKNTALKSVHRGSTCRYPEVLDLSECECYDQKNDHDNGYHDYDPKRSNNGISKWII